VPAGTHERDHPAAPFDREQEPRPGQARRLRHEEDRLPVAPPARWGRVLTARGAQERVEPGLLGPAAAQRLQPPGTPGSAPTGIHDQVGGQPPAGPPIVVPPIADLAARPLAATATRQPPHLAAIHYGDPLRPEDAAPDERLQQRAADT